MEKKNLHPQKYKIGLKHLPPIDPSLCPPPPQVKYEQLSSRAAPKVAKPRPKEERIKAAEVDDQGSRKVDSLDEYCCVAQNCKFGDPSFCSTKYIDPNSTNSTKRTSGRSGGNRISQTDKSKNEGAPITISAKTHLHRICIANNWKSPLFECCKEEGPDHFKLFTFKVTFVIESTNTTLECFSAPRPNKKTAAEHAAEGALWYLNFLGYFPVRK